METNLMWRPDFTQLGTGQANNYVSVWNTQSNTWLNDKSHSDRVISLAWSPDGKSLATSGNDNKIIVYDPKTLSTTFIIETKVGPNSVTWSPDSRYIAYTENESIQLIDMTTGNTAGTISGHDSYVYSLDWHSDGRLVSSSADGTVRVWQLQ